LSNIVTIPVTPTPNQFNLEQELRKAIQSKNLQPNKVDQLQVQKTEVNFDSQNSGSDLIIPIYSSSSRKKDKIPIGSLLIPSHTFGSGCTLTIDSGTPKNNGEVKNSKKTKKGKGCQKSSKNDNKEEDSGELLSPPLRIVTSGKGCGDHSSLPKNLVLEFVGRTSSRKDDGKNKQKSCVAFVEKDDDPWTCLDQTVTSNQGRGLAIYRSKTSHLT